MKSTSNFQLHKPDADDFYNIEDFNTNMDTIDSALKDIQDSRALNLTPVRSGRTLTDFSNWAQWYGTVSVNASYVKTGVKSLMVSTDASNSTAAARLRNTTLDLSGMDTVLLRIYVPDLALLSKIELRLSNTDDMAAYLGYQISKYKIVTGWNEFIIPVSDLSVSGSITASSIITTLQVAVTANAEGAVTVVYFDALIAGRKRKGSVLFNFDDGWLSQYTAAFPILRSKGMVGNIGVISDVVGTTNYMTLANLKELYSYGWDIFNHTKSNQDLTTLSPADISIQLQSCKDYLDSNGFTRASSIVAYPYGSYNDTVIESMKNYTLGRTVSENYELYPPINPYRLKIVSVSYGVTVDTCKAAIDFAVKYGTTVIFLFHKIEASNTETVNFLPDNFNSVVNYIVENKAGLDVLTWSEWLKGFETITTASKAVGGSYVGAAAPNDISLLWIDSANGGVMKYYNGSVWVAVKSVWG